MANPSTTGPASAAGIEVLRRVHKVQQLESDSELTLLTV